MYKKILLIDDDQDEQFFFTEALKEINTSIKFFYAASGKEGIQMFNFLSPDLVFVDINMPMMNGFECLEMLLTNKGLNQCTVIIYSTGIDNSICNKAKQKGVTACIRKQGSIQDLANILKTMLIAGQPTSSIYRR